jgi:peptidoglycan-associated lipoprotein
MTVLVLDNPDLIARAAKAFGPGIASLAAGARPPHRMKFHYGFNKHSLDAGDLTTLEQHAAYLFQHPGIRVCIHGHSDNFGAEDYNRFLARLRAHSVARILTEHGVHESRIAIKAWGAARPLATPDDHAANRRVELEYQTQGALQALQG